MHMVFHQLGICLWLTFCLHAALAEPITRRDSFACAVTNTACVNTGNPAGATTIVFPTVATAAAIASGVPTNDKRDLGDDMLRARLAATNMKPSDVRWPKLSKRTLLTPNDSPWNGNVGLFVGNIASQAVQLTAMGDPDDNGNGMTSGYGDAWPTDHATGFAATGMYGCTAFVVISRKGVYMAHIWENPVFWADSKTFNTKAIEYFTSGYYRAMDRNPTNRVDALEKTKDLFADPNDWPYIYILHPTSHTDPTQPRYPTNLNTLVNYLKAQ